MATIIPKIDLISNTKRLFASHHSRTSWNPSGHCNYLKIDCTTFKSEDYRLKQSENMAMVRHELTAVSNVQHNRYKDLIIVDTLQRLGIDYHFEDEIEKVMERHYMAIRSSPESVKNKDLHFVSLCFRLLRQQHYYVPAADAFGNFINKERNMEKRLSGESKEALMSLYEASQLRIREEDVLDEAAVVSSKFLEERIKFLNHHQAVVVRNTIDYPYHSLLSRFKENYFISDTISKIGCGKALQELANSDIAAMKTIHKSELYEVSRWWTELGLAKDLELARNQPLKWYMWAMALVTDPELSEERITLAKPVSFIYIIDDIFDLYGEIDELTIFTEAVSRWDVAATDQLPDYMKKSYQALYEITNEIGYMVYNKHGLNPVDYLAKTWATLCNAFLEEAKWFASGHLPEADEYLKNGIVSTGVHVALVHMFFLIGDGSTKENANLTRSIFPMIAYAAKILRLSDDLGSAKDENQEGKDGSYVACYMKEHNEASVQAAREQVVNMISDTWKSLNKECLISSTPYSAAFTKGCLTYARMLPLLYSYDDSQSLPVLEEYIKSIFMFKSKVSLKSDIGLYLPFLRE